MTWRQVLLLSCVSAVVLLSMLQEGTCASVGTRQAAGEEAQEDVKQKIFMQESEASNFLRKRGKRSPKSRDEVNAENRQKLRADELQREYYEEQRNEFENFVEEQNDGKICLASVFREVGLCAKVAGYTSDSPPGFELEEREQEERGREAVEQWRQWHYDGLYPSYLYNRHHI
ncbi:Putative cartilage matrix-associated protein [Tupaia chinensis]|uniref:Unique cartilage matrix-associated protein n=1 Tax=Tupaia chinensis TaxID=246437 RepID=L9KPU8_TUPCH|nr:Putative cartilage matrix-associated protein [Tupaia chinensis]